MARKIVILLLTLLLACSLMACSLIDKVKNGKETESESSTQETEAEEPSGTIVPVAATLESPAQIGDWVETLRYSSVDGMYHKAYFRIKNVIRDEKEVEKVLEKYNSEERSAYFKDIDNKDIQYCLLKYEISFPEDFPTEEAGIPSVNVDFSITTASGDIIKAGDKEYNKLNFVYDITETPEVNTLSAGQTFKDGIAVFSMVKDYNDYLIKSYYLNNNELVYSYIKGK